MKELNDLTDLEICKEIADIEGIQNQIEMEDMPNAYVYSEELSSEYDPLTDWNITGPLMDKYFINIKRFGTWFGAWQGDIAPKGSDDCLSYEQTSKRAICLAIIAQHRLKGDTE